MDGILAVEVADKSDSRVLSAIKFVLMHSLRDMALFANKERTRRQKPDTDPKRACLIRPQRMSRAVASSLMPTLSILRKLISRPLLVDSPIASALTKMKGTDFESLITNLPQCASGCTSGPKFSATQFARAFHLKLAKMVHEVWSDSQFACVPSHIMHPWVQLVGEVFQSKYMYLRYKLLSIPWFDQLIPPMYSVFYEGLEGAGKVIETADTRDTERLRDLAGATSRSSRILASMGLFPDQIDDNRNDQRSDAFEPSEGEFHQLLE